MSNRLIDRISAFQNIQVHRHGSPTRIHDDNQFNQPSLRFCESIFALSVASAANKHEANGRIESANRVLRMQFRCLRAVDAKSSVQELISEDTYAKNISKGQKLASSFELLYGRSPRLMDDFKVKNPPASVQEQAKHKAKQHMNRMMRANTRNISIIKPGDYVYFWRDMDEGWDLQKLKGVQKGVFTLIHNGLKKISSLNRVRKAQPPLHVIEEDDDPDLECAPQTPNKDRTVLARSPIQTRQNTREMEVILQPRPDYRKVQSD